MESNHYKPFEITQQGLRLRQRAIAGEKDNKCFTVKFTRCVIGQGRPEPDQDLFFMTTMVDPAADMPIKESFADDVNHIMVAVIDNANLTQDVVMTEIGIMAKLLNADGSEAFSEILYSYTYTDKYDYVPIPANYLLHREMLFNTILSRSANFTVEFDLSLLYATVQDLKDHINNPYAHNGLFKTYPLTTLFHALNSYPDVLAIEYGYGCGIGPCGNTPCGGTNGRKLRNDVEYLDSNQIKISVEKEYGTINSITKIGLKEYVVIFEDSTLSLFLRLLCDEGNVAYDTVIADDTPRVTSFNGRTGDVTLVDSDIPLTIARKTDIAAEIHTQFTQIPAIDGGEIL